MFSLLFYASSAAVVASSAAWLLVFASRRSWERETTSQVSTLSQDVENDERYNSTTTTSRSRTVMKIGSLDLPPPVRKHMRKTLRVPLSDDTVINTIKSLHVHQAGTFLLNGAWIPFTAVQDFSALNTNPGFVWDARMAMPLPSMFVGGSIPINVRDSYVSGQGAMIGKLFGFVTVVSMHDTPYINEGEVSRWLAESVLFPTALLPTTVENDGSRRTSLKWKEHDDESSATAELTDCRSRVKTEIEFRFGKDGLISSIYALRPYAVGDSVVVTPWEGHFYDYKDRDGMLVPTRMEVGWWKEGKLQLYFKGSNTQFKFTYV